MTFTDRKDQWTLQKIGEIYNLPLFEVISQSHTIHCQHHTLGQIEVCHLISVKTGGCTENCRYCAQSISWNTSTKAEKFLSLQQVIERAALAKEKGATRICLGAAWRHIVEGKQFDDILEMIHSIHSMGLEVCCTLGMAKDEQIERMKKAGLFAYNHNLDTSSDFYPSIVTTRSYEERLNTIHAVQNAGVSSCCGGIIGMGETHLDRMKLLFSLTKLPLPPDSIPINRLSSIPGTPLENQLTPPIWELLRMIAVTRIIFPKAKVRLSAGRAEMSLEEQALCFFAGANSIFSGEKLLTVPNGSFKKDEEMFHLLGLKAAKKNAL